MRRLLTAACSLLLLAASRTGQAADFPTGRIVRCTFAAIPKEHRAVAVFDALGIGHDGCVYLGTSNYGTPALLVRYNPADGKVAVVCNVSTATSENIAQIVPSGKIHTLLPVGSDGKIYFGTHLGDDRCMSGENPAPYGGGHFMVYDPATGQTRDLGRASTQESVMRVELDEPRQKLYGTTYPGGHLIIKDLASGAITDKGEVCHHGYAMPFLFADRRAYFFSRPGHIARYDPDADRIEEVFTLPPAPNGGEIERDGLYSSMMRGMATNRTDAIGTLRAGTARYLYRFRVPAEKTGACSFEWLGEVPLEASALVRSHHDDVYLFEWRRCHLYYYDTAARRALDLGIPTDAQGHQACLMWPAIFAADGTLYIGGSLDTPDNRFKQSGYGLGALGFLRFSPESLKQAINEASP